VSATQKFGLDISKRAVQMASKFLPQSEFVVASAYRLPVLNASCDVIFSVFAPRPIGEFERVLRQGGSWVTVAPGPNHLKEMRPTRGTDATMRAMERDLRRSVAPQQADSSLRVSYELQLTPEAAQDLFSMTPLVWQSEESHTPVQNVTVDVWVSRRTV
jgi:23S rRNA (guanine745-N1)-methyltransferase